jgi:hypothetical protein
MNLRTHHIVATALATPLIAGLAVDWVITGVTGHRTFITDDEIGPAAAHVAVNGLLGLAFASLAVVLLREHERFAGLSRIARACWYPLLAGAFGMAAGNLVLYPIQTASGLDEGLLYNLSGLLALLALALTFLPSLVLGLTQVRENRLGAGGRLLSLAVPALLVTIAVALVADDWASPVLLTVSVLLGLSLLGAGSSPATVTPQHEPALG